MKGKVAVTEIFLHPGEYVIGNAHCRITTLLGSCVAITLWHPLHRIGAMSHFLLPSQGKRSGTPPQGRYGDEVLGLMLDELASLHVPAHECQAKLFGGASMFPLSGRPELQTVGRQNGSMARRMLEAHSIPVVSESLFGVGHRKIIFDVGSGDVWARQGKLIDPKTLQERGER